MLIDIDQWRQAARAHAQRSAAVRAACTFVEVSRFVDPQWLVEIEVDAIVAGWTAPLDALIRLRRIPS